MEDNFVRALLIASRHSEFGPHLSNTSVSTQTFTSSSVSADAPSYLITPAATLKTHGGKKKPFWLFTQNKRMRGQT